MYLVVRRAIIPRAGERALLEAAARCALACRRAPGSPEREQAFRDWERESERKVVLRAREGEWSRLLDELEPQSTEVDGEAAIAALAPVRRSQRPSLIGRLQVFEPARDALGPDPLAAGAGAPGPVARLVVNGSLGMSVGKRMAQVAHAALRLEREAARSADPDLRAWASGGAPVRVVIAADRTGWDEAAEAALVLVRDAGLTEITPGSPTVAGALETPGD